MGMRNCSLFVFGWFCFVLFQGCSGQERSGEALDLQQTFKENSLQLLQKSDSFQKQDKQKGTSPDICAESPDMPYDYPDGGVEESRRVGWLRPNVRVSDSGSVIAHVGLDVAPGRSGLTPELGLVYSSRGGSGMLGEGWNLRGLSSIRRVGQSVVMEGVNRKREYTESDRLMLGGEPLIVVEGAYWEEGSVYKSHRESFELVEPVFIEGVEGPWGFIVRDNDGNRMVYGGSEDSVVLRRVMSDRDRALNGISKQVKGWQLKRIEDRWGNTVVYGYEKENPLMYSSDVRAERHSGQWQYPTWIRYTGHGEALGEAEVRFVYEENRERWRFGYLDGVRQEAAKRLIGIESRGVDGGVYRRYGFEYRQHTMTERHVLERIEVCDGGGVCLPETVIEWTRGEGGKYVRDLYSLDAHPELLVPEESGWRFAADFDGDGYDDILYPSEETYWVVMGSEEGLIDARDTGIRIPPPEDIISDNPVFRPSVWVDNFGLPRMAREGFIPIDWNRDGLTDLFFISTPMRYNEPDVDEERRLSMLKHYYVFVSRGRDAETGRFLGFDVENTFIRRNNFEVRRDSHLYMTNTPSTTSLSDINGDGIEDLLYMLQPSHLDESGIERGDEPYPVLGYRLGRWSEGLGHIHFDGPVSTGIRMSGVQFGNVNPSIFPQTGDYDGDGDSEVLMTIMSEDEEVAALYVVDFVAGAHRYDLSVETRRVDPERFYYSARQLREEVGLWRPMTMDANGDGLDDLMYIGPYVGGALLGPFESSNMRVQLSRGDGTFEKWQALSFREVREDYANRVHTHELYPMDDNMDGVPDFLATGVHKRLANGRNVHGWYILRGQGNGYGYDIIPVEGVEVESMLGRGAGEIGAARKLVMGDYNGDGLLDVLYRSGLRMLTALMRNTERPDHIKEIRDGSGFEWKLSYAELHKVIGEDAGLEGALHYPFTTQKSKRWVVDELGVTQVVYEAGCADGIERDRRDILSDGCLVERVVEQGYGPEIYHDTQGRMGFYRRSEKDNVGGLYSVRYFERMMEPVNVRVLRQGEGEAEHRVEMYPYVGLTTLHQSYVQVGQGAQWRLLRQVERDWETAISEALISEEARGQRDKTSYWSYPGYEREVTYEPLQEGAAGARPISQSEQWVSYDDVGRLLETNQRGGLVDERGQYRRDERGRPEVVESVQRMEYLRAPVGSALVGQEVRSVSIKRTADGEVHRVEAEVLERDAETGAVLSSVIERGSAVSLETCVTYDEYGNVLSTVQKNSTGEIRTSSVVYDALGMYPVCETDTLGRKSAYGWNQDLGTRIWSQDTNGLSVFSSTDGFGRAKRSWRPVSEDGQGETQYVVHQLRRFQGGVRYPMSVVSTSSASSEWTSVTRDTNGRQVYAEQLELVDGEVDFVISGRHFNRKGELEREYLPIRKSERGAGQALLSVDYNRDALGRVVEVTRPDRVVERKSYPGLDAIGLHTVSVDALGHESHVWTDGLGRPVKTKDALGGEQRYGYGVCGLEWMEDAEGNVSRTKYDMHCRAKSTEEPNNGLVKYRYDGWGQLEETESYGRKAARIALEEEGVVPAIKRVRYERDAIGRVVERHAGIWRGDVLEDAEGWSRYQYDGQREGKLDSVVHHNGVKEWYKYDVLGKPVEHTKVIEGIQYTSEMGYDRQTGNLVRLRYPKVEEEVPAVEVAFSYDGLGRLIGVQEGEDTLWSFEESNRYGQLTKERFGNGLITTYDHDLVTGRLMGQQTAVGAEEEEGGAQGAVLSDWRYTYDARGDLSSREESTLGQKELLFYDALERLTGVEQYVSQELVARHGYSYSPTGNLTEKTDLTNEPMVYGEGHAGPHALTSYGEEEIRYDIFGNATQSRGKRYHYSWFNKPEQVVYTDRDGERQETLVQYGPSHERVVKESTEGKTHYVGDHYQYIWHPDGREEVRMTVSALGKPIAVLSHEKPAEEVGWSAQKTEYLHQDRLGSTDLVSAENPQRQGIERLSYDVFGKRRDPFVWNQAVEPERELEMDRGFTGHEHDDELGVIHMKGRVMDPVTGRFLSADPFSNNMLFSQDANRYSYVRNNPLGYTDPSGFSPYGGSTTGLSDSVELSGEEDEGSSWWDNFVSWWNSPSDTKTNGEVKSEAERPKFGRDGGVTSTNAGQTTNVPEGAEWGAYNGVNANTFLGPAGGLRYIIKELIRRYILSQTNVPGAQPGIQPGVQPGIQPGIQPMPQGALGSIPRAASGPNPAEALAQMAGFVQQVNADAEQKQRRDRNHKSNVIVVGDSREGHYGSMINILFPFSITKSFHYENLDGPNPARRISYDRGVFSINPLWVLTSPGPIDVSNFAVALPGFNHFAGYPSEALQAVLLRKMSTPMTGFVAAFAVSPEEFKNQVIELSTLPGSSHDIQLLAAAAIANVPGSSLHSVFSAMGLFPYVLIDDPFEVGHVTGGAEYIPLLPSGYQAPFNVGYGGIHELTDHMQGSHIILFGHTNQ